MEHIIHDEKNGLNYRLVGDYYLPMLKAPKTSQIGRFGKMHYNYIRKNKKCFFCGLQLSGKTNAYIEQIDREAEEMFENLVKQFAENEGITEQLKADNQLKWVSRMNNIHNRAEDIIKSKLLYN